LILNWILVNQKEKNSLINKNNLDSKLNVIYNDLPNIPQIEFKKINENEYFYGTCIVKINIDPKNANNITGNNYLFLLFTLLIINNI
jgi:hypothetical protein